MLTKEFPHQLAQILCDHDKTRHKPDSVTGKCIFCGGVDGDCARVMNPMTWGEAKTRGPSPLQGIVGRERDK